MGGKDSSYQIVYRGETSKTLNRGSMSSFNERRSMAADIGWAGLMKMGSSFCWRSQPRWEEVLSF